MHRESLGKETEWIGKDEAIYYSTKVNPAE